MDKNSINGEKELLNEGIKAFKSTIDEVLKKDELTTEEKMKFSNKCSAGIRHLKEALEVL